jgi:hypothetical protein
MSAFMQYFDVPGTTYEQGEGLLELGDLFFGERVGLN